MGIRGFKNKSAFTLGLLIVLIAAVLRFSGLFTELWFDEICSIRYVQSVHSAWQALWSIHTDNKHHLIWLWIWLTGPDRADWVYRLPSFFAGIILPVVLYRIVLREFGFTAAVIVALLSAFCYPLIFYSSEARGYSLAVLLAVLAYSIAPDRRRVDSRGRAMLFSIVIVLGFLSHLTFVFVYAGLLAWAVVDVVQKPRWIVLLYHLPAMAVLALIYIFDVSKLQYGGGQATDAISILRWMMKMMFAAPIDGIMPWIVLIAVIWLCTLGLIAIARKYGEGRIAFFITAILIVPMMLTAARRNPFLAVRYYLVCVPFVLMLMSIGLSGMFRSLVGKIITAVVIGTMMISALQGMMQLNSLGRGHALDCLLHMSQNTPGGSITYGSERMVMDRFNIEYYSHQMNPPRQVIPASDTASDWWILDLDTPLAVGPPEIHRRGRVYKLDAMYPSDPVSGLTWDLYRVQKKN